MTKSQETRRKNEQVRRDRHEREQAEIKAQAAALRQIRDNPQATPGERLEAVKLLMKLQERYFYIL
jgi:hypothetical protein|nr:MAG TPA: hypothetical protein [Bacteriophage sp.]